MTEEEKLGVNKFHVDENFSHIEINKEACPEDIMTLVRACPAGLYKYNDGTLTHDCAGCFECGVCRILSAGKVVSRWEFPKGGKGIEYRFG
ncbi:MAG: 4Fe-4S dicluster domain-containing protein [Deferribacteraceae bacterium]|jgi:ferredoxin-like protein FixX|nr:4Fe-4S dicluster domain-containing protein [Deferribacteraceae bacterium]